MTERVIICQTHGNGLSCLYDAAKHLMAGCVVEVLPNRKLDPLEAKA